MSDFLNDGVVTISLGGEPCDLKATPAAAMKLSRFFGGIAPIFQRLQQFDLECFCAVIRIGANMSDKDAQGLSDRVWGAGMTDLVVPLVEYITLIANGGKKAGGEENQESGGKPLA